MRLLMVVLFGLSAMCIVLVGGAGGASGRAPAAGVSVSGITAHSAKVTAKINPEGSETSYKIWFDRGCNVPACERAGPFEAKTGHIGAGKGTVRISITVRELEEAAPNNETWVEATNASGTTKSKTHVFKSK
jgi:hypothetical protein